MANKIQSDGSIEEVSALTLEKDDLVLIKEGEIIPSDGDIIEGTALVDESAITGESAPVVRESGGDKCGVTGGTKLLSGTIRVKITVDSGETFLDNMINMVESAKRQKTPNEMAFGDSINWINRSISSSGNHFTCFFNLHGNNHTPSNSYSFAGMFNAHHHRGTLTRYRNCGNGPTTST